MGLSIMATGFLIAATAGSGNPAISGRLPGLPGVNPVIITDGPAVPPQGGNGGGWRPRTEDWNFVQARNIAAVRVNRYVVQNNTTVINNTTIINNVTTNNITNNRNTNTVIYNRGPKVSRCLKISPILKIPAS